MDALRRLAEFAANVHLDGLPPTVVEQAKRVLLDTVGAAISGSTEPEIQSLAAALAGGPARILGSTTTASAPDAVLINAMAACWYELDEGHRFARGHPAIHVLPVVLALATNGQRLIESLVAGYEVAVRIGMACRPRPEFHPHGMVGAIGAAAAAVRLRGGDSATMLRAIQHAASLMFAPPFANGLAGTTIRNAYAGVGAQHGLLAASLARAGISSVPDSPSLVLGSLLGTGWDDAPLVAGLGERYEISRNYFKRHASCRHTHGAIELLYTLLARDPFTANEVDRIDVTSYGGATAMSALDVATPLAARFSIPTLLALILLGHTDLRDLPAGRLADPAVRALARRVHLATSPAADHAYPTTRQTHLTVRLTTGRTLTIESDHIDGDPEAPLSDTDLDAKFLELTGWVLGDDRAERAIVALRSIDTATDLGSILDLLVPAKGVHSTSRLRLPTEC